MKPERWRCGCIGSDGSEIERSAFAHACQSCGVVAPWFKASRALGREDMEATKGKGA